MTTFEEAQAVVLANLAPKYPAEANVVVATYGWENEEIYLMAAGPHALIYGPSSPDDAKYIRVEDGPRITVRKDTGEYIEEWGMGLPPIEGLTPVGTGHPVEDDTELPYDPAFDIELE